MQWGVGVEAPLVRRPQPRSPAAFRPPVPVTIERCNTPNDLLHRLVRDGLVAGDPRRLRPAHAAAGRLARGRSGGPGVAPAMLEVLKPLMRSARGSPAQAGEPAVA